MSSWGDQALKSMLVLHSDSGSGKSMLTSILHDIYGTYCFPMTTQALNGVDASGPKPELMRHATMRCGIINEATALTTAGASLVKQWTGGDASSEERQLYSNEFRRIRQQSCMLFITNHYDGHAHSTSNVTICLSP